MGKIGFISLASQASKTVELQRETLSASASQEVVVPQGLRSTFRLIGRCGLLQIPVKRGELCAVLVDMRQHGNIFRSELGTRVIEQPRINYAGKEAPRLYWAISRNCPNRYRRPGPCLPLATHRAPSAESKRATVHEPDVTVEILLSL